MKKHFFKLGNPDQFSNREREKEKYRKDLKKKKERLDVARIE